MCLAMLVYLSLKSYALNQQLFDFARFLVISLIINSLTLEKLIILLILLSYGKTK